MPQQQNVSIILCHLQFFIRSILPKTINVSKAPPVLRSDRRCSGRHLGLIMLDSHSIIYSFHPFSLHTYSAPLIIHTFYGFNYVGFTVNVSIFHCSLFPSLFFFISKIFLDIFFTKDNLAFFLLFLSWPKRYTR